MAIVAELELGKDITLQKQNGKLVMQYGTASGNQDEHRRFVNNIPLLWKYRQLVYDRAEFYYAKHPLSLMFCQLSYLGDILHVWEKRPELCGMFYFAGSPLSGRHSATRINVETGKTESFRLESFRTIANMLCQVSGRPDIPEGTTLSVSWPEYIVVYLQLVDQGFTPEEARELMEEKWFHDDMDSLVDKVGSASYYIGERYNKVRNHGEALNWYMKAANHRYPDPESYLRIGNYYMMGKGVSYNDTLAKQWFEKAHWLQDPIYSYDHPYIIPKDPKDIFNLGQKREDADDLDTAILFYKKAVILYQYGPACDKLGWMNERGIGMPVDKDKAFELYKAGAEADGPLSRIKMNLRPKFTLGKKRHYEYASFWFNQGKLPADLVHNVLTILAERGRADAHFYLGVQYANGSGVERDLEQSAAHYRVAADAGFDKAKLLLDEITKKMEEEKQQNNND
jgi:TPR repeat protein